MNYHNIVHDSMTNGDGIRVVLFVSGCDHFCKGCQNKQTWNKNSGIPFDENAKKEIFTELEKDYISGLTLSGGDPLFVSNRHAIRLLCEEVKAKFPQKTIWLYTGYLYEEIATMPILDYVDVIVDGKYIEALKDSNYKWAGSTNQRIINLWK